MGVFDYVEVHPLALPEEYRELTDWQTKSIDYPMMATYRIAESGELLRRFDYVIDEPVFVDIKYHGVFSFYTLLGSELVVLEAKFTDGKLVCIKEVIR